MRKNKAITLIALVITIVVLIILAAVAINLSLGNNGIFNRAKTGKELYQNSEEYEKDISDKTINQIDSYVGGDSRDTVTISKEEYEKLLNQNNYSTEEKVVGTWTDGKPIYKKVVHLSLSGNFSRGWNNNYAFIASNIDTVVSLDLRGKNKNYSMLYSTIGSTGYISTYQETGDTYGKPSFAIVEYTKTTDTVPENS